MSLPLLFSCFVCSPPTPYPISDARIQKVEHRDAAANCSSDDEDLAAALAGDESSGGSSDGGGAEGEGGRVGAYGYVSDGFLVPDDSIEVNLACTWFPRVLLPAHAVKQQVGRVVPAQP